MIDKPEGIHLFSNGTEFDIWESRNCSRCIKEPTCDLLNKLFTDGLEDGLYQGQVLPETAARLGYSDEYQGQYGWPCAERQAQADPPPPAAREMRKAGGVMLPGFDAVPTADTGEKSWQA
jgi:hypothetical protein